MIAILKIIFTVVAYLAGIGFFGLIGILAWVVIIETIREMRND